MLSLKKVLQVFSLLGIAAVLLMAFQNCGQNFSSLSESSSALTSATEYTNGVSGAGLIADGQNYSDPESSITITNNSTNTSNCNASDSVLSLKIKGAGNSPTTCLESFIVGRENSFRCTQDNFVALAGAADWTYSASQDVWTYQQKLQSHLVFVPGIYKIYFEGRTQSIAATFEIKSPTGSCQKAVASTPPVTDTACLPATGVTTTTINSWSFAQQKFTLRGTNTLAVKLDSSDTPYLYGTFAVVAGSGGGPSPRMSFSTCPGDFSLNIPQVNTGPDKAMKWTFETTPPFNRQGHVKVERNKVYYLNFTYKDTSGQTYCTNSSGCTFHFMSTAATQ